MKAAGAALALLLALGAPPTLADARVALGLHFGIPLYWPGPYYYGYYPPYYYPAPLYYPPPLVQYTPPPTYAWYYYCAESKAYYPYVRECPGGWERVSPVPPPPAP